MDFTNFFEKIEQRLEPGVSELIKTVPPETLVCKCLDDNLMSINGVTYGSALMIERALRFYGFVPNEKESSANARWLYCISINSKPSDLYLKYGFVEEYSKDRIDELSKLLDALLADDDSRLLKAIFGIDTQKIFIREYARRNNLCFWGAHNAESRALRKLRSPAVRLELRKWFFKDWGENFISQFEEGPEYYLEMPSEKP